jgi:hypothetical protein
MNSAFCASVLKVLVEGKSIFSTVATHTPRNSYLGCAIIKVEKSKTETNNRDRLFIIIKKSEWQI